MVSVKKFRQFKKDMKVYQQRRKNSSSSSRKKKLKDNKEKLSCKDKIFKKVMKAEL